MFHENTTIVMNDDHHQATINDGVTAETTMNNQGRILYFNGGSDQDGASINGHNDESEITTATTTTPSTTTMSSQMIDSYLKMYEERMLKHIYEQPHTPPTSFEIRIRHQRAKEDTVNIFKKYLMQTLIDENDDDEDEEEHKESAQKNLLLDQLEMEIDKCLERFETLCMKEYRWCQTGFVIGWKDNQQQQKRHQLNGIKIDDRF